MRVIVDTNVLVSAALRDRDPEAVILYIVGAPGIEWMATRSILDEYRGVLRRPKLALPADVIAMWDKLVESATLVVESVPHVSWSGDPGDAMFVACALGVCADVLITGDRGLLRSGRRGGTLVTTAGQFKREFCDVRP